MARSSSSRRRERILLAARAQFEATGFRGASIARIAEEAGVAPGTIYWHFESKEALFLRLFEDDNARWFALARDVLGRAGTALERLVMLSRTSADFYRESKLLLSVLRRDGRMLPPSMLEEVHARLARQSIALLAELIQQGIDDGSIRAVDPEKTAAVLFAAGHALFNQSDFAYEDLVAVLVELTLRGLARAGPDADG
jgi:AcrR family transcriptional regulator